MKLTALFFVGIEIGLMMKKSEVNHQPFSYWIHSNADQYRFEGYSKVQFERRILKIEFKKVGIEIKET
ncbi:MAG: hypothetical protein VW080_12225 [Flavobacteriaceae bacterium]